MDDDVKYDPLKYAQKVAPGEVADKIALLPGLNSPYKASSTVDGEVPRLVVIMGKDGFRIGSVAYVTLQYTHLGTGELIFTATGQIITFLFSDLQPKLLTIHGRNLLRIYHHIGLKRMAWIRQTDRDFRLVGDEADEPVITRIEVSDWKRPKEEIEAKPTEKPAGNLA